MAGDVIQVQYSQLEAVEQALRAANQKIQTNLDDLESQLKTDLGENWTGAAQAAYAQSKAKWDAAIAAMNAVLPRIQATVNAAQAAYQQTDTTNAHLFG